jgi:deazaflavin-dependent oxidoreductase (nitroreductase family)
MTTRHSERFYAWIGAIGTSRLVTRIHPVAYRITGGRWIVGRNLGITNVVLATTGRHTGRTREVPLYAFEDGERYVVVGSANGSEHTPAWVWNLRAQPEGRLRVGRRVLDVRTREAEGEERTRLWRLVTAAYPGYELYQARTRRRIPLVVLEPCDAAVAA